MLKRNKVVIIDGYNVLRNSERYALFVGQASNFEDWTSEVWNAAREALLNDALKTFGKNDQVIIVYDAAKREVPTSEAWQAHGFPSTLANKNQPQSITKNCQVIFTDAGESADARIQKLVYVSRQKGMDVQVVTSDFGIQDTTMNKGVVRTSSREFVAAVADQESDTSANSKFAAASALDSKQPMRTKIEDAVDAETAAKLRQLRDSL